ncbi:MAG: MarR family transcriptional regulator [Bacteroidales bacterium]|jgi:DNA-binding MarR family transcriptional regulator|nr:MarR family transcriptional regulator [Bacteroidales bacterium]
MNDLDKIVNHRLATVSLLSRRLVFRIIAESGVDITPEQWTLLYYLWKENGQSIGELSKATQKDFANVTRIVEKLIEHGYVKKERDVNDNRSFRIFILPKANEIKNDIKKVQEKMQDISLNGINDDEQIFIMQILDKMEKNILKQLTSDNK